jgi:hydroxymethylpyrimidine pyrophosphatase-like HAD family hydrolase
VHALDGHALHEFALDESIAHELAAFARDLDHSYEWFNPLRYLVSRETEESRAYAAVSGVEAEYVPFPERAGVTPTGVGIISTLERANAIHRQIVARYGDALHVLDFPAVTVAVAPDANKGHALSLLAADMRIDRHEVLAIGDSVNDAAMLAWAGTGLAMAHSDAYALDAADGTLDPHPDALAAFLESLVRD